MQVAPEKRIKKIVKTVPDIKWVKISAGKFIFGSEEEKNQAEIFLDTFYISAYLITNLQYQCFVDDGGYEDERWWQAIVKPEPSESVWPHPNRPKTDVDWYEAIAFCRWLSVQLGFEITLPTEQQWEKAARGTDGREYPWGDGYRSGFANVDETANKAGEWFLEQTCAVGLFPQGESPAKVLDMSGNVWEWCLNQSNDETNIEISSSKESCVLRGGSCIFVPRGVCASFRFGYDPGYSYHDLGFRVCCILP